MSKPTNNPTHPHPYPTPPGNMDELMMCSALSGAEMAMIDAGIKIKPGSGVGKGESRLVFFGGGGLGMGRGGGCAVGKVCVRWVDSGQLACFTCGQGFG